MMGALGIIAGGGDLPRAVAQSVAGCVLADALFIIVYLLL